MKIQKFSLLDRPTTIPTLGGNGRNNEHTSETELNTNPPPLMDGKLSFFRINICFFFGGASTLLFFCVFDFRDRKTQPTEFYPPKFGLFLSVFEHIFESMKNPDCSGVFHQKRRQKATP